MSRERGYSLIELLLVVSLLGTLVTLSALSTLRDDAGRRVERAASNVALALRGARTSAIMKQKATSVTFDPDTGVYSEPGLKVNRLPPGVRFARPDAGSAITFAPPGAPADKTAAFSSAGLLQSTVRPAEACVGIPAQGLYRRIRVNLVGQIEVSRWTGTAWK